MRERRKWANENGGRQQQIKSKISWDKTFCKMNEFNAKNI